MDALEDFGGIGTASRRVIEQRQFVVATVLFRWLCSAASIEVALPHGGICPDGPDDFALPLGRIGAKCPTMSFKVGKS